MNFFGFAIIAAILALASALPAGHWEPLRPLDDSFAEDIPMAELAPQQEEHGLRFARATCDLLSMSTPWGSANHSICAAHCIAMMKGFRGGRCINGVCNCRK